MCAWTRRAASRRSPALGGQCELIAVQARGDEASQLPDDHRQRQDQLGYSGDLEGDGEPGDGAGNRHALAEWGVGVE